MNIRITSFNVENLFGRYRFLDKPPEEQPKDYASSIQIYDVITYEPGRSATLKPATISEAQRRNTGAAILAAKPDILAVCEVENLTTLRLFNAKYLGNYFDRIVLIDGNDPRGIDVGLLVRRGLKANLGAVRSHADEAAAGGWLATTNILDMKNRVGAASFSRDCLEADVDIAGTPLTFLVNHFKAQEIGKDNVDSTTAKRRGQAERAAKIVASVRKRDRLPIVLGDMNKDIAGEGYDGSVDPLVNAKGLFNAAKSLDSAERWTHYFASKRSISQLDYILVDASLRDAVQGVEVFRGGLTPKCKQYDGPRVGTIADDGLEASDHCPVSVDLKL